MKCVCILDVVMVNSDIVEFTKGHVYYSHPDEKHCLINNSGDPHYVSGPSCSDKGFFDAHFIEILDEKFTPHNRPMVQCKRIGCGKQWPDTYLYCPNCGCQVR